MKKILLLLMLVAVSSTTAIGNEIDLSGTGWKAWLDPSASWQNDTLYLPDELHDNGALSKLPVNQPTGGWQVLGEVGKNVSVPMTIDEYFLDGINTNTYTGVSWVWRTFEVPEDWKGKVLLLQVEKARMRAEVYINQKLAAYDVVGETPFQFDVSPYLNCGAVNHIAIRLTNPGGRRGWMDEPLRWGRRYNFSSAGINFSTLGHVRIAARDQVFIEDVFVKNLLPAGSRNVEVVLTVNNKSARNVQAVLPVTVTDLNGSQELVSRELSKKLPPGLSTARLELTLSGADLWAPETPVLYNCRAEVKADGISDIFNQRFGVRVIQWLSGDSGEHNFYLNGKRFFVKTA
ncbi:MAG TPA: hypothetical protein VJ904_11775, partial [Tichowtungia sp.]|nr:hypothetical protein [Tichowtungia sp.]